VHLVDDYVRHPLRHHLGESQSRTLEDKAKLSQGDGRGVTPPDPPLSEPARPMPIDGSAQSLAFLSSIGWTRGFHECHAVCVWGGLESRVCSGRLVDQGDELGKTIERWGATRQDKTNISVLLQHHSEPKTGRRPPCSTSLYGHIVYHVNTLQCTFRHRVSGRPSRLKRMGDVRQHK
jgi:hypothetical protein